MNPTNLFNATIFQTLNDASDTKSDEDTCTCCGEHMLDCECDEEETA